MTIEIFKTDIKNKRNGRKIIKELRSKFPQTKIDIDFDDCDKILRLEGQDFIIEDTVAFVNDAGHQCEIFE